MNRPFLFPVVGCASGVICGWYVPADLTFLWLGASMALLAALIGRKRRVSWLLLLCFLAGWINVSLRTGIISANDLRLRVGANAVLTSVTGVVVRNPVLSRGPPENESEVRWRVVVAVDSISEGDVIWPGVGKVMVYSKGGLHHRLWMGTEVRIFGVLKKAAVATAPGLFDYRDKLRREGIHFQMDTVLDSDWQIIEATEQAPMQVRFRRWAQKQFATGLPAEDESLRLLWAMVLGWRVGLTDEVAEPFMRSGTMHIFAISGLHVAIIAGVLIMLLRVVARMPRQWCGILVIPALVFYCAATGWQASATRATLMMSIVLLGWALRRPVDLLNSVCAAAFIILMWDPLQLMQASFQLSFSVVSVIAILLPRCDPLRDRIFQSDPLLLDKLEPRWRRLARRVGKWSFAALALSFCAWLGSMPLIAFYFQLWTPGCLLANPLVVLFAMAAICSAMGGLLLAPLITPVAVLFNHGAWFWVAAQVRVSQVVADLPGGCWEVSSPRIAEVITYYAILLGFGCRWLGRKGWRGGYSLLLGLCLVVLIVNRHNESQGLEIAVLGHNANAIFFDFPGDEDDLLIDCGRREGYRRVLEPFLKSRRVSSLPNLVLTHGDADHIEAFNEVVAEFHPRAIVTSHVRQLSPGYREIIDRLAIDDRRWKRISSGDRLGCWKVLHPGRQERVQRADDATVVLLGEFAGTRILLVSDLGLEGRRRLMASGEDLTADILILAGSVSGEYYEADLLSAVDARLLIVQDNSFPVEERMTATDITRLRNYAEVVMPMSRCGSVCIRIKEGGWQIIQVPIVP